MNGAPATAETCRPSTLFGCRGHSNVVRLSILELYAADAPCRDGLEAKHVWILSEAGGVLPPISDYRATVRVVDGMHRLAAVLLRGLAEIEAVFADCAENEVFRLSVGANIAQGSGPPGRCGPDHSVASGLVRRSIARSAGLPPATVTPIRPNAGGAQGASHARNRWKSPSAAGHGRPDDRRI